MGFIFGNGKKAARIQADATMKAANMQASADRMNIQAMTGASEAMLKQKQAADKAAALLSKPQKKVDVLLATDAIPDELDPDTGKRRSTRNAFMGGGSARNTGIRI